MRRLLCVFLCALLLQPLWEETAYAEEVIPEPVAYAVVECSTGTVLADNNGSVPVPVGTMAKLMTALLAGEKLRSGEWNKDDLLTASDCVNGIKGAVIWLVSGESMTVDGLLKGLIIGNANDAAAVIAESISGSAEDFVKDMNARAFELGMRDTHFTSPQGYDDDEAYSTARDIGLLCGALSECECLDVYFTTWRDFLRDGATELVNENTFARTYEGMTGWKAGHSDASGWCIAVGVERDGMECAAVILGSPDEDSRFVYARKLLKECFVKYTVTLPGFSGEHMKPVKVKGGTSGSVEIRAESLSGLVVPSANTALTAVIVLPKYVHAPVEAGKAIGTIAFYNDDVLLYETKLVAKEPVEAMTVSLAAEKLLVKLCKL